MTISDCRTTSVRLTEAITGRTSRVQHGLLAATSIVALGAANTALEASYEASGHPVSFAEGQLAFDGPTVKGWYAHMETLGTLDTYVATQVLDFAFIAAVASVGIFFATAVARATGLSNRGGRAAGLGGVFLLLGAAFDAIENGISFLMLADPQGFPNVLALPYSTFAAAKFASITVAMALLVFGLGRLAFQSLRSLVARGPAIV